MEMVSTLLGGVAEVMSTVEGNATLKLICLGVPITGAVIGLGFRLLHRH